MSLPWGDDEPDSSDDERSLVMKFFDPPTTGAIPSTVALHHQQQQPHHHQQQQQQQYQHPFQRMEEEEQRPQLQPRHPQQKEQLQKPTLNPKRERSPSPRASTGTRLPSTTQLSTRPPLSTLAASINEALALKTPFDSKLSSKTPKRPKVTFSHPQGRHQDGPTSNVSTTAVGGQFDDAEDSDGDEELILEGFATNGQSSRFSDVKAGNSDNGSLTSSKLDGDSDDPMPGQDDVDSHYEDGSGDMGANDDGAFDIDWLPVGKLYEDIPVSKALLLQSVHPTRHGVVLTNSLNATSCSARGGDGDCVEKFDLLTALDGQEVYDIRALRSIVDAPTVAQRIAESNDDIYIDVLRVKGLHNVILTGGIGCWVNKLRESTAFVIESMCKFKQVPYEFERLHLILSSDFEEDDFEYKSAISTLSSDLSVIHDVSLDGCLHLINGEDGNPAVALMELMTVLHEFCVDPSNCPPVARDIASYLLLRVVPSSKEDLVLEGMAMMPKLFSGLQALIDALGIAKGDGLQINVLFAHGSDNPVRGGKYPYQPYSPDMKSALCKFSMSCFSYWYDDESSGPLYKLARIMQPGQIAIPWAELDEFDQPVPVSANARGKRGFLNVCMTALSDPGKARAEIVKTFSTDLKSRAYNQNIIHFIHNSAYKACISERFYQGAIREMGLSAYFKFPRTEVETLLDQMEALSQRESSGSGLQSKELVNMLESLTVTASSIMSSLTLESDSSAGQQLDDDNTFGDDAFGANNNESSDHPLEKERIAKEKADAARLERERRKKERLAAAKAAADNQYTNEACENRIVKSIELLQERLEKNELDKDGPQFHPIEVDLPEAHNKTMVDILCNEEENDAEECIVQLGEACSNVLKVLQTKRIIIGQLRDRAIDKIEEDAPDIDEGAGMGAMLAVLESKDGQNYDDSITTAAKDCVTLAVERKVLEKKGASPCNWFNHHSALGHEYKAAMAKCIGLFSLMTVATNVPLAAVLVDSDTLSDAKVLAEGRGYESLNGLTLGQFTFLIGAPSILGNIETEMEMAMGVICKGFLGLLSSDFVDIWRLYGDKIMLPDEDGVIRFSETAPDYFSDTMKGTARKTGVVLNLLTVFQSPIIASLHSGDIGNLDGKQLARALLRCPTADIVTKTKLLKQGDLLFSQNTKKVTDASKFISTHLTFLLKKSKGRAGIYLKYCVFLDLRRDIHRQLEHLLKVLNRSDLEIDLLQKFVQYSFD